MSKEISEITDGAVFLEQSVDNLVDQLSIPIIEVALVVSGSLRQIVDRLEEVASEADESGLPRTIVAPWPIREVNDKGNESQKEIPIDRLISATDSDRMDILRTLISESINMHELPLFDAALVLRRLEFRVRSQLKSATRPQDLYQTLDAE